jgi:DNA-binding beta-propeller fold protein YncE
MIRVKCFILAASFACLLNFATKAQGPCSEYDILNMRKTAIVIGEKSYKISELRHTLNDASDIRDSLKKIGFEDVTTVFDSDLKNLTEQIDNWCKKLNQYDVALFYFSGHGAEVSSENFLFPIDADPQQVSDLYYSCYSVNKVIDRMNNSGIKYSIAILDACRENPFLKRWEKGPAINGGLAMMSGMGAFIGLAASPGMIASDGLANDRNGIYTAAILKHITSPNETIDDIFTAINAEVRDKSSGQQVPIKISNLSAKFCLSVAHQSFRSKKISYVQPASLIMLTDDQDNIITADPMSNELAVRDSKSLSVLKTNISSTKAKKLIGKSLNKIFIIDSLAKKISIFSYPDFSELFKMQLALSPISLAVTEDEKIAFLGCLDSSKNGILLQIDLVARTVLKSVNLFQGEPNLTLSPDSKRLYIISSKSTKDLSLLIFDVKSGKLIKKVEGVGNGDAVGISPDNKQIYLSFDSINSFKTNIIDLSSSRNIKSLDIQADAFAFTPDGKYVLITSGKVLNLVRREDNELLNILPFATKPNGVVITDDERAVIWLPDEHRPYVIDINDHLRKTADIGPDQKRDEFNKKVRLSYKENMRFKLRPMFRLIEDSIQAIPDQIIKELEGEYRPNYSGISYDSLGLNGMAWIDIRSGIDQNKHLMIDFSIQGTIGKFTISFYEQGSQNQKQDSYNIDPTSVVDWRNLKASIRKYIMDRLEKHLSL